MTNPISVEQLTPLDASMPRTYIRVVLVFEDAATRPHPATELTQRVQSGLNAISAQIPWLSGKVVTRKAASEQPYSLEIQWDAETTPTLVDKGTIDTSYETASAQGMPPECIPEAVWPVPGMIDEALHTAGAPVFAASIFRFADRGLGLCVCMHHNAVDGAAFAEIIQLWARHTADPDPQFAVRMSTKTRCEQLSGALAGDQAETSSISTDELFKRHPEYSRQPPALPKTFPSCICKLFRIPHHWINTLKTLLRKYTSTPPSTNTILSALLWTTITRVRRTTTTPSARPSDTTTSSRLATAVNARQRLGPTFSPQDSPYLGNAILYALTKFPAADLAASDETPIHALAKICDAIVRSQATSTISQRHVAEVNELITRMDRPGALFVGWDLFNARDLTLTSWADFDLYGVDFGFGDGFLGETPAFVRLPYMEADGVVIVLPRRPGGRAGEGEGKVEVMVMLRRDHMNALGEDEMWRTLICT
ncbi:transferase family-domain-containing protein [Aspergillus pseudoustus]|uniref:Transferase family-domain-containing protein n=1 Tax=Aspergillus pseudoustus TaxID=1810923 RepID=A0ABR4K544_9EURO